MTDTAELKDELALPAEGEHLVRTFDAELQVGDGRTIDLRVVPYNEIGTATDPPDYRPYPERFLPGAFERQMSAANRVSAFLNLEHEQGVKGIVGHGNEFRDESDGLYGSFRVHNTADGDKTLEMVNDGFLRGVSLEFAPLRSVRNGEVVERVRAHLDKVALCRTGVAAYQSAEVLAVRTTPLAEVEIVKPLPDELLERLQSQGVAPLDRLSITKMAWDESLDRFDDEQYEASCLLVREGDESAKERCAIPVLEPDGQLNVNALGIASIALQGPRSGLVGISEAAKAAAARKLLRYYRLAGMDAPKSTLIMARK